jgi:hypothetical protein
MMCVSVFGVFRIVSGVSDHYFGCFGCSGRYRVSDRLRNQQPRLPWTDAHPLSRGHSPGNCFPQLGPQLFVITGEAAISRSRSPPFYFLPLRPCWSSSGTLLALGLFNPPDSDPRMGPCFFFRAHVAVGSSRLTRRRRGHPHEGIPLGYPRFPLGCRCPLGRF